MAAIPITYNIRSLMVRRTTSLMTALGIALVVMVVVILLSFVSGLRRSLELVGEPGHWIVLSRGTVSEGESYIPREQADILRTRPEIATDAGRGRRLRLTRRAPCCFLPRWWCRSTPR